MVSCVPPLSEDPGTAWFGAICTPRPVPLVPMYSSSTMVLEGSVC